MVRVFVCSLLLCSCYQPRPRAGAPCAPDLACPEELECDVLRGICVAPGTALDGGIDGHVDVDAPPAPGDALADAFSAHVCTTVDETAVATVTCPHGVISSVVFASYGTPTGACGSFQVGACDSTTSQSEVEARCLGMASCSVDASNNVFGDPCVGTNKTLSIEVVCQ